MLTKTPFLKGLSALLFGSSRRKKQELMAAERQNLRDRNPGAISNLFREELSPEIVCRHASTKRHRVYSQEVTFWAFLSQVLSENRSCALAVSMVQQWMRSEGLPVPSSGTASYTEARRKLPVEMLEGVHCEVLTKLDRTLASDHLWRGHRVMAIDATSAQLPDTAANQAAYPQPSNQAAGCGFPVIQIVGLINLCHGGFENFTTSALTVSEYGGFDQLESHLKEGDILTADRLYSTYEIVARLRDHKVEFIGRPHGSRKLDFRRGKRLGPNERLQVWRKPRQPSASRLSKEEWDALPEQLHVRLIRTKGPDRRNKCRTRYVVTTLTDPLQFPAEEVASIYVHRWEIELRFRDIKTTMGMDELRTKTPQMAHKEIMMHLIAYNLLRLLSLKAAIIHHRDHRRIGIAGVLQVLDAFRASFEGIGNRPRVLACEKKNLLERIAERSTPERPGRNEPRKKKRRPKPYGWLQVPRRDHPEHFRSDDHPMKILAACA